MTHQTPPPMSAAQAWLPALLAAITLWLCLSGCHAPAPSAPSPKVALAHVVTAASSIDQEVWAGEIRARVEADHAFRIGGKIVQRLVDAGATVKAGQVLARLDPQDTKLGVEAARAQVAAQQADADLADLELKRARELFSKGFISQSALDQKISIAGAARARLNAQQAQARVSDNQASYAQLVAESNGVVTQVLAEVGQVVAAGQPVLRIADPRDMELSIAVSEAKVGAFRKARVAGKDTNVMLVSMWAQPHKHYAAQIREVAGAADPATRTWSVRVSLKDADDAVQLGMSAFAHFGAVGVAGALSVPLSSLLVKDGASAVWKIGSDGKLGLRPVKVLQYRETSALIEADAAVLAAGDVIVATGVHKLREGEVVKPLLDAKLTGDNKVATPATTQKP